MYKTYQKPEAALKRAEGIKIIWYVIELIAVGQNKTALETLQEILLSKRIRSSSIDVLETLVEKAIELCVNLRQSRILKDILNHYKLITQISEVTSMEVYIDLKFRKSLKNLSLK